MQQQDSEFLISTEDPTFIELVELKLKQDGPIIVLLRYSHHGGAHEYFILKHWNDFQFVLQKTRPKDALTIFFKQSFPINGIVDSYLINNAKNYLREALQNGEEAVFIIRLDAKNISLSLDEMKGFSKIDDLEKWLSNNLSVPVFIGLLAFWDDKSDETITAYVPSVDGHVRRGAY